MKECVSVLFILSLLFFCMGVFWVKRNENREQAIVWVGASVYLVVAAYAFCAAILFLFRIPLTLGVFTLINLVCGTALFLLIRKRGRQKYRISVYDLILLTVLITLAIILMETHYGGKALLWNYYMPDPAAHYRAGTRYLIEHGVERMFFAQIFNGIAFETVLPWIHFDELYHLYVALELIRLVLSGLIFYGCVRRYCNSVPTGIFAIILTVLYLFGYPLNAALYGFCYLQMGIDLIAVLILVGDAYNREELPRWYGFVLLMLLMHGLIQCYALFAPAVFVAVGLFLISGYRRKRVHENVILHGILTAVFLFLLPLLLGLWYTYRGIFMQEGLTISEGIAQEGLIYRNLYGNFIPILPFSILGYYALVKKEKQSLLLWVVPVEIGATLVMFLAAYLWSRVSGYYFYKNYYLIWMLLLLLAGRSLSVLKEEWKKLVIYGACGSAVALFLYVVHFTERIEDRAPFLVDNTEYRCFPVQQGFLLEQEPYPEERLDLVRFVRRELIESGITKKPVALDAGDHEYWLYEALTGQDLKKFRFFEGCLAEVPLFVYQINEYTDYVCVYTEDSVYKAHQFYFDSLEKVYENEAGFVAKTKPAYLQ